MTRALHELANAGVSVWLDDLSRDRLDTGGLVELIHDFHVVGVTTNPTIFATAIDGSTRYDDQLALLARHGADADAAVRALTVQDVTAAADLLTSVAQASDGVDGRVSLEVDPRLAADTEATLAQARELWHQIERPNVFIKIPATAAGLPAIRAATAEGISVNATLIFSRARHRAVMSAYLDGIRDRLAAGGTVTRIASVASFFVSRVDTAVDGLLERRGDSRSLALRGQAAIANARLAYREAQSVFSGERWETLARQGARPQRPLWASTSVKNPAYPDTMYVTELVAAGTVNTMPEATLRAVADHGEVTGDTITSRYDDAERVLADLADVGIDLHEVTRELEEQGVAKFAGSWRELLDTVAGRLAAVAS